DGAAAAERIGGRPGTVYGVERQSPGGRPRRRVDEPVDLTGAGGDVDEVGRPAGVPLRRPRDGLAGVRHRPGVERVAQLVAYVDDVLAPRGGVVEGGVGR